MYSNGLYALNFEGQGWPVKVTDAVFVYPLAVAETVTVIVPPGLVTVTLIGSCNSRLCPLETETGSVNELNDAAESPKLPSAVTTPAETT